MRSSIEKRLRTAEDFVGKSLDFIPVIIGDILYSSSRKGLKDGKIPVFINHVCQGVNGKIPVSVYMQKVSMPPQNQAAQAAPTAPVETAQAKLDRLREQPEGAPLSFSDSQL